jgi:hypothetical protein
MKQSCSPYQNKNPIEQSYDKKKYQKLGLNKLKVMRNSTSIYIHLALSSNLHVAHVHPCVN